MYMTKKYPRSLTQFDKWWINLLPPAIKKIMPPWQISAGVVTLMAFYTDDQTYTTMVALFWASLTFTFVVRKIRKYIGDIRWLIPAFHATLLVLVALPALAQTTGGSACPTGGLFSAIASYVVTLFSSVTYGGSGTLGTLFCQVIGYITVALVLTFISGAGYVAYQINYNNQPLSTAVQPLMGFLIFAGISAVVINVLIGQGAVQG